MMSLAEERAMREKQAMAAGMGAARGVSLDEQVDKAYQANVAEERTISEEEWGFTASLHDLVIRARWGIDSRRVAEILYQKAKDLELEVQRSGPK